MDKSKRDNCGNVTHYNLINIFAIFLLTLFVCVVLGGVLVRQMDQNNKASIPEEMKINTSDKISVNIIKTTPSVAQLNSSYEDTRENPNEETKYPIPQQLNTKYIFPQQWPPTVSIQSGDFNCPETPPEFSSKTERISQRIINDKTYCVKLTDDGVAGSIYSSYAYTTSIKGKLVTLSFVLRLSNCENYNEQQNQACVRERETFTPDELIDQIFQSISWDEILPNAK